jgi:hypothetical protein
MEEENFLNNKVQHIIKPLINSVLSEKPQEPVFSSINDIIRYFI